MLDRGKEIKNDGLLSGLSFHQQPLPKVFNQIVERKKTSHSPLIQDIFDVYPSNLRSP